MTLKRIVLTERGILLKDTLAESWMSKEQFVFDSTLRDYDSIAVHCMSEVPNWNSHHPRPKRLYGRFVLYRVR